MLASIKSTPHEKRASIVGLRPEMAIAFAIAIQVYAHWGASACVLTSGPEGKHGRGSLHLVGLGIDLRPPNIEREAILRDLRAALGPDFDVVDKGNHFHMEFQPKVGVNQ